MAPAVFPFPAKCDLGPFTFNWQMLAPKCRQVGRKRDCWGRVCRSLVTRPPCPLRILRSIRTRPTAATVRCVFPRAVVGCSDCLGSLATGYSAAIAPVQAPAPPKSSVATVPARTGEAAIVSGILPSLKFCNPPVFLASWTCRIRYRPSCLCDQWHWVALAQTKIQGR
jgi:hypothetical protein